jgi:hypothetical protein
MNMRARGRPGDKRGADGPGSAVVGKVLRSVAGLLVEAIGSVRTKTLEFETPIIVHQFIIS